MAAGHSRSRRRVLVIASVVAVALQLWGVYRPTPPPGDPLFPHFDKVLHAVGFALPVLLLLLLLERWSGWVLGTFAGHAVVSEVIQSAFYRRRSGDPLDVLADLVGVGIGAAVFGMTRRARRTARSGSG
jgi:VanZ family protein